MLCHIHASPSAGMQLAALHTQASVGEGGVLFVVGDNDKGGAAFFAQAGHQFVKDAAVLAVEVAADRKSTRLNSSH